MGKKINKEKQKENFERNEKKIKDAGLIELTHKYRKKLYLCLKCNTTFWARRNSVVKSPVCRNCMQGASFGEQIAIDIFLKNNIMFEKEKKFKGLKGLGHKYLRFDFLIKKNDGNIFLLEIDGAQHYLGSTYSGNTMIHDSIKEKFCLEHNLKLYRVKYRTGRLAELSNNILGVLKNEGYNVLYENPPRYFELKRENSKSKVEHKPKIASKKSKLKKKYYAVKRGRVNDIIVESWDECKKLVDKYSKARYKSFATKTDAENYLKQSEIA